MKICCLYSLVAPLLLFSCNDDSAVIGGKPIIDEAYVIDSTVVVETSAIKNQSNQYLNEKNSSLKYDLFFGLCKVVFKKPGQLITEDQIIEWFGPPDTRYDEEGDLRLIYDFGKDPSGTFSRNAGFHIEDGKSRMPFIAFAH